ncbi:MAG: glycosyltransferase N-terminal domain-containing protein [Planctomycetota bacterium]
MNALDLVYATLAGLTAPLWMRKRRAGWDERLARAVDCPPKDAGRPRVMLHAVSVGEVNAMRSLVPALLRVAEPIVTTTTDTGLARARDLYADVCPVLRYPLDFSGSVGRFLDAVRPDAVGLVELELWPNFLAACRGRAIPVAVINGRLSERSFRGYRRARPLVGGMFRSLDACCVQDDTYAERFREMGSPGVRVTGSMKWDIVSSEPPGDRADRLAEDLGIDRAKPLIVAGSTGPGEEALLHAAVPAGVQLLCAPRKPERFDEAAASLPGCVRRSAPATSDSAASRPRGGDLAGGRFLLDTIGELRAAYALADLVVVGRSFFDLHGSDPIEPIALGRATVIGPAVGDFEAVVARFEESGGVARSSRGTLAQDLGRLLDDERERSGLAERGLAVIDRQRGASDIHASTLLELARR